MTEDFFYDVVNRLEEYRVAAPAIPASLREVTLQYNALGNILYKSDVGVYSYPASGPTSTRPHAVSSVAGTNYTYDANGNVTAASAGKYRTIAYTSFNLPDSSNGVGGPSGSPRHTWQYDENHQRIKQVQVSGAGTRTTWSCTRTTLAVSASSTKCRRTTPIRTATS